jgi:predicted phosphoribosyltransferase
VYSRSSLLADLNFQSVSGSYKNFQSVSGSYKNFQSVSGSYKNFQSVSGSYKNFARRSPSEFGFLINLIGEKISKKDTVFRKAISVQ